MKHGHLENPPKQPRNPGPAEEAEPWGTVLFLRRSFITSQIFSKPKMQVSAIDFQLIESHVASLLPSFSLPLAPLLFSC